MMKKEDSSALSIFDIEATNHYYFSCVSESDEK